MKFVDVKKSYVFFSVLVAFLMIAILIRPKLCIDSTLEGLSMWLNSVLPALFPFLFLTKLLTNMKIVELISKKFEKITKKLFNVSGLCSYVFVMSLLSGYPIGAKLTSELFLNGKISKTEADRMTSFCSTSGPLFVVGTVGIALFADMVFGFVVLIAHILGAILNGIVFRKFGKNQTFVFDQAKTQAKNVDGILAETMFDSVISVLMVGGFVTLFFVFVNILFEFEIMSIFSGIFGFFLKLFGLDQNFSNALASGFFEVTRGCKDLASIGCSNKILLAVFVTGLVSFGGLSVHLQSLAFLQKCKTKIGLYFLMKTTQCLFSMMFAFFVAVLVF